MKDKTFWNWIRLIHLTNVLEFFKGAFDCSPSFSYFLRLGKNLLECYDVFLFVLTEKCFDGLNEVNFNQTPIWWRHYRHKMMINAPSVLIEDSECEFIWLNFIPIFTRIIIFESLDDLLEIFCKYFAWIARIRENFQRILQGNVWST